MFKKSVNLDAKGAKRSVKIRATNFYEDFFQKYLSGGGQKFVHNLSKYVIHQMF